MKLYTSKERIKLILLIDERRAWNEQFASALQSQGFLTYTCDVAHASWFIRKLSYQGQTLLIVLSCSRIEAGEERLITEILARQHPLLVLCNTLVLSVIRALFLQGVNDIADQPLTPADFVSQVNEVLTSLVPRNCYQAIERESRT